ncbi:Electron transfer flavoprotein-ubiquinone oxidoreductase, mitochondrial [uncultured Alphaproteobacteria bacterium]|uniref:Electron transfer flavoprotein-ubiquinone oxidoreductase n=1 Tax=uncultured Alphaproteobacteria bacterium TaxID=91750 RepID=A0A212JUV4_9PROT|nr:Electron transfer flavoprotein-ubiquinone oxidoreductase, mitochondrial [uncultured Alphaproteobacteria bacterium]
MDGADREVMEFDVLIVGGGPAGLAAAIRLRRAARAAGTDLSVAVVEKGSEIGAHILSGAVIETRALDELIPDWRERNAPVGVPVTADRFVYLTERRAFGLPTPPTMRNAGNRIVSLGNLCRWLAGQAEELGADVFPGFAAAAPWIEDGRVVGAIVGDMGRRADGSEGPNFQPGVGLRARVTLVAEGCRGSLAQDLIARYRLDAGRQPQTYGLGIKELWDVDPARHTPGLALHSVGWPLPPEVYGGGFVYHAEAGQVAIGFVVGLDYRNPHLSPFEEFQRFKTHPAIRKALEGGRRVGFGARALAEGGWQSVPEPVFPGGALIGDCAGFVNVPKVKGTHTAMMSGILAADAALAALRETPDAWGVTPARYPALLRESWVAEELKAVRNVRPAFRWGLWPGMAYAALDTYVLRGRAPWTFGHHPDHARLLPAAKARPIVYPKPDGVLTFDRASSVYLANTTHDEAQPVHLRLRDPDLAVAHNLAVYGGPEAIYCPVGVYEFVDEGAGPRLRINASNCVHCKTCDIKDPRQNIRWTVPEGGSGPNYPNM